MKKKAEKIIYASVIVPTRNEESRLKACLDALMNQKTKYLYEIIIVDTKSTDNTISIAEKYNCIIIHEPISGRNIARKTGTEHAKGKIICFTEADCIVPENWIETIVETFNKNLKIIGVVGRYTFINSTPLYEGLRRVSMPITDNYFRMIHGHYPFRASNCAITNIALKSIGGVNTKTREFDDVELSMRASKKGSIQYLPNLYIKTEDRRVKDRIFRYLGESLGNYFRTCILKQYISEKRFADIR